ncbi:MAG: hypothetical protein RLY21_1707 [Planctomycetota bacterium]|jgi:ribokinase
MGASIHVIGSLMIDRVSRVRALPRAGETIVALSSSMYAGGKGANQAAAAAKCGGRVRMLGRTGRDGAFIVDALRSSRVDVEAISTADEVSGSATVLVADSGENAIVIAPESNTRLVVSEIEAFLEPVRQGDIVLFQNECSCLHEGIALAAARALRVWLNAAPADGSLRTIRYEKLSGLVLNETEAEVLTGEADPARALESLAARMPHGTVIVTLGAQGAIAALGRARHAHRGFEVDAVDTVGCGDAFVGAYLAAIAEGLEIPQALARANAAGALAAMRAGAIPSLATRDEIEAVALLPERARLAPRASVPIGARVPTACVKCGYDLTGKAIGEICPECGNAVQFVGPPPPLTRAFVERILRGARIARSGALLLLLVPMFFLAGGVLDQVSGGAIGPRLLTYTALLFVPLMVSQVVCQAIGAARIAVPALPTRIRRTIRIAGQVRTVGFIVVGSMVVNEIVGWLVVPRDAWISILFVFLIPALVIAADIVLVWMLRSVVTVVNAHVAPRYRLAATIARVAIFAVPFIALFPFTGWFFAPTLWALCIAICHKEVAESARVALFRLESKTRSEDLA